MATDTARLQGAFGATGSGKTAWAVQQVARHPLRNRLAVWDFKHDRRLAPLGTSVKGQAATAMPAMMKAMKATAFKLRYMADHDADVHEQFKFFCMACWEAGNVLMVVDELPEVTAPGRAPPVWRKCINVGREYTGADGKTKTLAIIGMAQRCAEVDKSFLSNLDVLHVGRMGEANDARDLAAKLGCDWRELTTLPNLHWIEKRAGQVEATRGVLSFRK